MSSPETSPSKKATKAGLLYKKSAHLGDWRPRLCSLRGEKLSYALPETPEKARGGAARDGLQGRGRLDARR